MAAAEAVLQEASTAVAKQLRKAIPEAQNMFSSDDAVDPAAEPADCNAAHAEGLDISDSENSSAEVC